MQLTKNFSLAELTTTSTGIDNTPPQDVIDNLLALAGSVLQPARERYGRAITVNSGYRSPAVNKRVGGATSSQHMSGQAADITTGSKEENRKLFAILETMNYDQLIDEKDMSWIHVSYKQIGNRRQKLKL
jgi:zinc D-Ala-D-Ala carboxypeptidase